MKVLMVTDTFLPLVGGGEIHVLELSKALRRIGVEITICTATPGSSGVEDFNVIRLPELENADKRNIFRAGRTFFPLIKAVMKADVVHGHYTFLMSSMAHLMSRPLKKPTVSTLHGLGTLDSSVLNSKPRKFYRWSSMKLSHKIIATSLEMAQIAQRFAPPNRIVQIPNGVNTSYFNPDQYMPGNAVVLTMRRLAPKNGVQFLVESAPYIIEKIPNVEFWVAGEDKLFQSIQKRVLELNLKERFKFIGNVKHDQTKEYYEKSKVVVFPSSAESTSLACLEALSMERVVVASKLSAYIEMLGENEERGILVDLYDREWSDYNPPKRLSIEKIRELADAICKGLKDESQMTKKGREFVVSNYDWKIVAEKTLAVYRSILKPS